MGQEKKSDDVVSSAAGSGLLWLVAIITTTLVVQDSPILDLRPHIKTFSHESASLAVRDAAAVQDVDARLWVDPFDAVRRDIEHKSKAQPTDAPTGDTRSAPKSGNSHTTSPLSFYQGPNSSAVSENESRGKASNYYLPDCGVGSQTEVVGAMVSGANYPESEENRRRIRYAVVSGLAASGYVPFFPDQIGYLNVKRRLISDTLADTDELVNQSVAELPESIPWETYYQSESFNSDASQNAQNKRSCVLLLWIDEDSFKRNSGRALGLIQKFIYLRGDPASEQGSSNPPSLKTSVPTITILGPESSKLVENLALESMGLISRSHPGKAGKGTTQIVAANFYSYSTSVPDRLLAKSILNRLPAALAAHQSAAPDSDSSSPDQSASDQKVESGTPAGQPEASGSESTRSLHKLLDSMQDENLEHTRERQHEEGISTFFSKVGEYSQNTYAITFNRLTLSDDDLINALACELSLRHVPIPCRDPHTHHRTGIAAPGPARLVLISEHDTLYGRTMASEVNTVFGSDDSGKLLQNVPLKRTGGGNIDCDAAFLKSYSYFRGIDGQTPTSAGESSSSNPENSSQAKSSNSESTPVAVDYHRERSEGQAQLDYLRRMGDQIAELDTHLKNDCHHAHIDAIGILGSDVYDKLQILQALREKFPDAMFFTTDLDARFIHRDIRDWTRNLLIASSFGLSLNDLWQGKSAPFRDSRQTSAFLATRISLSTLPFSKEPVCRSLNAQQLIGKPLVYEVARSGFFSFNPYYKEGMDLEPGSLAGGYKEEDLCRVAKKADDLRPDLDGFKVFLLVLIPQTILAIAIYRGFPRKRRMLLRFLVSTRSKTGRLSRLFAFLMFLTPAVLLAVSRVSLGSWITDYGRGEPVRFFEGISAWPTLILRTSNFVLCVFFLFWVRSIQKRNLHHIWESIHIGREVAELTRSVKKIESRLTFSALLRRAFVWRTKIDSLHKLSGSSGLMTSSPFRTRVRSAFSARKPSIVPAPPARTTHLLDNVWEQFIAQGQTSSRIYRAIAGVVLLLMVGVSISVIAGGNRDPLVRGEQLGPFHSAATLLAVLSMQFLILFIADACFFCAAFIRRLEQIRHPWPAPAIEFMAAKYGAPLEYSGSLVEIEFIAKRTVCLMQQVYLPLLAIGIMVFARNRIFDHWTLDPAILIMQSVSLAIALSSFWVLRSTAERARSKALLQIQVARIGLAGEEAMKFKSEQLERMSGLIADMREGAFAPIWQQPFVRALLLPLGGFGGGAILQKMLA